MSCKAKVASLVPGQGMCLGCGLGPQLGACVRQPINVALVHGCLCPSPSPSFLLSLKINKIFFKNKRTKHTLIVTAIIVKCLEGLSAPPPRASNGVHDFLGGL